MNTPPEREPRLVLTGASMFFAIAVTAGLLVRWGYGPEHTRLALVLAISYSIPGWLGVVAATGRSDALTAGALLGFLMAFSPANVIAIGLLIPSILYVVARRRARRGRPFPDVRASLRAAAAVVVVSAGGAAAFAAPFVMPAVSRCPTCALSPSTASIAVTAGLAAVTVVLAFVVAKRDVAPAAFDRSAPRRGDDA